MPKRPESLETVRLCLELMRRIPRKRKVTAAELHAQLQKAGSQRDLRTIQRMLEMLSENFDIERDDSERPYGYCWLEQAETLSVPGLTAQESLLLTLAEQHIQSLLPAPLMRSMKGFFEQARHNLSLDPSAKLEKEWRGKVRVVATSQPLIPPKIKPGIFETVSESLFLNRWVHLDYRNARGDRNSYDVMPLGLAQQGPCMYLVCRYKGFDNERSVALHRIQSAEMSLVSFERPPTFDLKRYDEDGRFGFGEGEKIRLSFQIERANGVHLLESPLSTDQQAVVLDDGRLQIAATVVDTEMLDWWLRGFGRAVSDIRKIPVAAQGVD